MIAVEASTEARRGCGERGLSVGGGTNIDRSVTNFVRFWSSRTLEAAHMLRDFISCSCGECRRGLVVVCGLRDDGSQSRANEAALIEGAVFDGVLTGRGSAVGIRSP